MSQRVVADMRYAQSSEVVAKWQGLLELIARSFLDNLEPFLAVFVNISSFAKNQSKGDTFILFQNPNLNF